MEDSVPFGSEMWWFMLAVLVFGRSMDFLSTWIATPNLVVEANPLARKLGWKWGIPFNLALCIAFASWPFSAIIITTTSILVAARNFQSAWLIRTMGEWEYTAFMSAQMHQSNWSMYLLCLIGQTGLTAMIGTLVVLSSGDLMIPLAIGVGIIAYAAAVLFYTLLSVWRIRRRMS
ncbi:MAG TPA: hypothetical protein VK968_08990 [Roseimicrobium sp.]|nr:hypothetical protein [Roseimicrobium sp.]